MNEADALNSRIATVFYGKFQELRPAQKSAIQPILNGENIILCSGTGSGKTEAVLAPLLSRYWSKIHENNCPTILYIAPTKALINDLAHRITPLLQTLKIKVGIRHGDKNDLVSENLPQVLITTPESLEVLMIRKDKSLLEVQAVVMDEVHLLYNTQRGLQLSCLLQRLSLLIGRKFQWVAISATVSNPSYVRDFLFGCNEPVTILTFDAQRAIDAQVRPVKNIDECVELMKKLILRQKTKILLFADSRRECERLAGVLSSVEELRPYIFAHYSSLSPEMRQETESKFALTHGAICVATSTLELGIDIGDIDLVILWDIPGSLESFLQRIGRGNRRANKTNVLCLINDRTEHAELDVLRYVALIDSARKGELSQKAPYELYGALAQQNLSVIISENGAFVRAADMTNNFNHINHVTRNHVDAILSELASKEIIQKHGYKNRFGADEAIHQFVDYGLIYGNYGAFSQTIDVKYHSKTLGAVPAINLLKIRKGMIVPFGGKNWLIIKNSPEEFLVEPARNNKPTNEFIYLNTGKRIDGFITNRIWSLIHSDFPYSYLTQSLKQIVQPLIKYVQDTFEYLEVPQIYDKNKKVYLTFAGYTVNKAIGLWSRESDFIANDLFITTSSNLDLSSLPKKPEDFEEFFGDLFEVEGDQSIYQSFLPADLKLREFIQPWIKDKYIVDVLDRLRQSIVKQGDPKILNTLF